MGKLLTYIILAIGIIYLCTVLISLLFLIVSFALGIK